MTTKLTLTIEEKVVVSAKKYAKQKRKSLSNLVGNYLKSISSKESDAHELSPKITKLMGIIKLSDNYNYKKDLGRSLSQKYK